MKSSAATLLILHGWNLSQQKYEPLVVQLRLLGYQVHTPDLPGFGSTAEPLRPMNLNDYVNWVIDYMKKNTILSSIIIGHSFGGRIALAMSTKHEHNIKGLVLTGVPVDRAERYGLRLFIEYLSKIGKIIIKISPLQIFTSRIQKVFYNFIGVKEFIHASGVMQETFKLIVSDSLFTYITTCSIPTVIIWGEKDQMTPIKFAIKLKKLINKSQLKIISHAGHDVPYTQASTFAHIVHEFVKSL